MCVRGAFLCVKRVCADVVRCSGVGVASGGVEQCCTNWWVVCGAVCAVWAKRKAYSWTPNPHTYLTASTVSSGLPTQHAMQSSTSSDSCPSCARSDEMNGPGVRDEWTSQPAKHFKVSGRCNVQDKAKRGVLNE
jgi:hypothetical protein